MICYIHTYPKCAPVLAMLWPGLKRLGYPIGVECVGEPTAWPEPIGVIQCGINAQWQQDRYNLPSRLIQTLRRFLLTVDEHCCITEYDVAVLGEPPEFKGGIMAHRAGGQLPGARATQFFHFPMWFDRDSAKIVAEEGLKLLLLGIGPIEGSPDVFLGLLVDLLALEVTESGTFSRNSLDTPEYQQAAREAYRAGVRVFHGVKSRAQLDSITA